MTIHRSEGLERSIRSLVEGGRFESEDEAVRSLLSQDQATAPPGAGSIGP